MGEVEGAEVFRKRRWRVGCAPEEKDALECGTEYSAALSFSRCVSSAPLAECVPLVMVLPLGASAVYLNSPFRGGAC